MSPEQLLTLQKLSRLFEDGLAGPDQIKQLSDILASLNHNNDKLNASNDLNILSDFKPQL